MQQGGRGDGFLDFCGHGGAYAVEQAGWPGPDLTRMAGSRPASGMVVAFWLKSRSSGRMGGCQCEPPAGASRSPSSGYGGLPGRGASQAKSTWTAPGGSLSAWSQKVPYNNTVCELAPKLQPLLASWGIMSLSR